MEEGDEAERGDEPGGGDGGAEDAALRAETGVVGST